MGNKKSSLAKIDRHPKTVMASVEDGRLERNKLLLNVRQQELLRKSWQHSQANGFDSAGTRILKKIFITDPTVARIFDLDGVIVSDLAFNPKFQPHADTITKTVTFIINNLGHKETMSQHAQALGARHVKFESRGFKTAYWDVFIEAITECAIEWEGGVRCSVAMKSWRILVVFFVDHMRLGFEQERRKKSSQSIPPHISDSLISVNDD